MQVRATRTRKERMGLLHDPLEAVPLTTVNPPPYIDTRLDIQTVARQRTAKEAFAFAARGPAAQFIKESNQMAKSFAVEMDATRRDVAAREAGLREGLTADKLRAALAVHSDALVAAVKTGVVVGRLPPGIAERSVKATAARQGRRGDAAWERSAMNESLATQYAANAKAAMERSKAAVEAAKLARAGGGEEDEGGEKDQ